jgi:hypothetical protein
VFCAIFNVFVTKPSCFVFKLVKLVIASLLNEKFILLKSTPVSVLVVSDFFVVLVGFSPVSGDSGVVN